MYTNNPGSRNQSSLPHRQLEYSTPDTPSILSITAPPPPLQPIDFRSRLSSLARGFAAINVGDYAGCETFMKQNPEILDEKEDEFVKEAAAAMHVGKDTYAICCVQQSLLLRNYKQLSSSKERKDYFTGLIKKERQALRDLISARDAVMINIQTRVQNSSHRPATQNIEPNSSRGGVSFDDPPDRHGGGRQGRHTHPSNQPNLTNNNSRARGAGRDRRSTLSNASDAPTFYGPGGSPEALDERYHIRKNGAEFFTFGRVFATLWHSSTGISRDDPKRGDQVRPGRFGELIHSHIQRMAVVKEDHGFCWCIPINTYNGQGVAKHGFNDRDIRAHAIIYMIGCPSEGAIDEPEMRKQPIEVKPAAKDQQLDIMSRIHFGKVHTVEHNVKVMNVGHITQNSLQQFEVYWNNKAAEENCHADRPK